MGTALDSTLFEKDRSRFQQLQVLAKQFVGKYCVNSIIGENIYQVITNYARKHEVLLDILRYPFNDDELWAFTFLKKGKIFVCINSQLPLNKQVFAAAHELYHIYCYVEDVDQHIICQGSLLDSKTVDDVAQTQEDVEANAFAAMLLLPDDLLNEQISLNGVSKDLISIDDVLGLMDFSGIPYKAVVLRLYESGNMPKIKAEELLNVKNDDIQARIQLTGKAKRWMLDGRGIETFGSLLDDLAYNAANNFLTDSRRESDMQYISELKKRLNIG